MKTKNTTFIMVVLSTAMLFAGCNNDTEKVGSKQEPTKNLDLKAGVKLVQLVSSVNAIPVKDIWGNKAELDKFYAYTNNAQIIPISYKANRIIPGTKMSIEEYVSSLVSLGNYPDTSLLPLMPVNSKFGSVLFKVYPTGDIGLDASLN